jgi:hypothetical protein
MLERLNEEIAKAGFSLIGSTARRTPIPPTSSSAALRGGPRPRHRPLDRWSNPERLQYEIRPSNMFSISSSPTQGAGVRRKNADSARGRRIVTARRRVALSDKPADSLDQVAPKISLEGLVDLARDQALPRASRRQAVRADWRLSDGRPGRRIDRGSPGLGRRELSSDLFRSGRKHEVADLLQSRVDEQPRLAEAAFDDFFFLRVISPSESAPEIIVRTMAKTSPGGLRLGGAAVGSGGSGGTTSVDGKAGSGGRGGAPGAGCCRIFPPRSRHVAAPPGAGVLPPTARTNGLR